MFEKLRDLVSDLVDHVERKVREWTRPRPSIFLGAASDLLRGKNDLVVENALLRQQLIVLRRQVTRTALRPGDRVKLVLLARLARSWQDALLIVKPDTVLRWHRRGFRMFWRRKSRGGSRSSRIPKEIVSLIRDMALSNRLWGAERMRGELLKLGIRLSKRTIQRYLRRFRPPRKSGQTSATFVENHAHQMWACDFLQTYDILFRPIFAFFLIEVGSRKVVQVSVTRAPSQAWTAQQLRNATPWGQGPRFLIRDNDDKFGTAFDAVAKAAGTKILRTPIQAPRANAVCERFLGSVRRDCLDHIVILSEQHLLSVLREYVAYFNEARPHQGIDQRVPVGPANDNTARQGRVIARPVLGGLHHAYRRVA